MSSIWDEFATGEYVEFNEPGDTVTGSITGIDVQEYQGKKYPQLNLTVDGEPRTLTAWNVELISKLRELKPNIGDVVTVTFLKTDKIEGGKTMKRFDVKVAAADKAPF